MTEGPAGYAQYADQMAGVGGVFQLITDTSGGYKTASEHLNTAGSQLETVYTDLVAAQGRADEALPHIDAAIDASVESDIIFPDEERIARARQDLIAARKEVAEASGRFALAATTTEEQKAPVREVADHASVNAAALQLLLGQLQEFAALAAQAKGYATPDAQ